MSNEEFRKIVEESRFEQIKTEKEFPFVFAMDTGDVGEGSTKYVTFVEQTKTWIDIAKCEVARLKESRFDLFNNNNMLFVRDVYVPFAPPLIKPDTRKYKNNLAGKNNWRNPEFDFGKKPEVAPKLPEVYDWFFKRLFPIPEELDIVFDWISDGMKEKLQKFLYVCGPGGIGKGILGETLAVLHGDGNYKAFSTSNLHGNFNTYEDSSTLIYFDEPSAKTKEVLDKLKLYMNKRMSLEKKGKDAYNAETFFNLYISGNDRDGIVIDNSPEMTRRFFCPEPTSIPLKNTCRKGKTLNLESFLKEIRLEKNLTDMFWFFKMRETKTDFASLEPTPHHKKLIEASASNYMREVIAIIDEKINASKEKVCYWFEIENVVREKNGGKMVSYEKFKKNIEGHFGDLFLCKHSGKNPTNKRNWITRAV